MKISTFNQNILCNSNMITQTQLTKIHTSKFMSKPKFSIYFILQQELKYIYKL